MEASITPRRAQKRGERQEEHEQGVHITREQTGEEREREEEPARERRFLTAAHDPQPDRDENQHQDHAQALGADGMREGVKDRVAREEKREQDTAAERNRGGRDQAKRG